MRRIAVVFFLFCLFSVQANERFMVVFQDKVEEGFDPYAYFDTAAIKSKELQGLPVYDWYDLPVNSTYSSLVGEIADSVRFDLRWFNSTVVYAQESQISEIVKFPFVKEVVKLGGSGNVLSLESDSVSEFSAGLRHNFKVFDWQLKTMGGQLFKKNHIDGTGIRVCVVDVGFPKVDEHPALKHLFNGNYIEGWDFIRNKKLKFNGFPHGKQVLNFIAGKVDGHQVGLAPNVEILLARTEWQMTERRFEEEVWVKAIEWAHQKGARLVNSSLGYHGGEHTHSELDGETAMLTKAGNLAAKKGLLVVNAAGNEGDMSWKRIVIPADGDSILAVGGISPSTGVRTDFSSYGPSRDKRVKPNVSALGTVHYLKDDKLEVIDGTSFSAPLVTGFAACVLQMDPSLTPMELMDTLQKVSSLYPYFDYSHGYGVPQASKLFGEYSISNEPSIKLEESPNYLEEEYFYFSYTQKKDEGTQIFYHIEDKEGYVKDYKVVSFEGNDSPKITYGEYEKGDVIRAFHRGTCLEKRIE